MEIDAKGEEAYADVQQAEPTKALRAPTLRSVRPVAVGNEQLFKLSDDADATRYVAFRLSDSKLYVAQLRDDIVVQEIRAVQLGETLKVDPHDTKPTTVLISSVTSKLEGGFLALPVSCEKDGSPLIVASASLPTEIRRPATDAPAPAHDKSSAASPASPASITRPIVAQNLNLSQNQNQTLIRSRTSRPEPLEATLKRLVPHSVCVDPTKRLRVINSSAHTDADLTPTTRAPPTLYQEAPSKESHLPSPPKLVPIGNSNSSNTQVASGNGNGNGNCNGPTPGEMRFAPPSLTDFSSPAVKNEATIGTGTLPEPLNLSKHQDDESLADSDDPAEQHNDMPPLDIKLYGQSNRVRPPSSSSSSAPPDANNRAKRKRRYDSSKRNESASLAYTEPDAEAATDGDAEPDAEADADGDGDGEASLDNGAYDGSGEVEPDGDALSGPQGDLEGDLEGDDFDDEPDSSREGGSLHQKRHSVRRRDDGKRHNEPLRARAVAMMQRWFDLYRENPYPDEEIKARFALEGGISMQQVNGWFANRRNRTNSTRPKIKRKILEERIRVLFSQQPRNITAQLDTLLDLVSTSNK